MKYFEVTYTYIDIVEVENSKKEMIQKNKKVSEKVLVKSRNTSLASDMVRDTIAIPDMNIVRVAESKIIAVIDPKAEVNNDI